MATVSKSNKINFYKFVQVKEPGGQVKQSKDAEITRALNSNTKAVNNLGLTVNSLAKVLTDLKKVAIIDLEREQKQQKTFKAKFASEKAAKRSGSFLGNLGMNKVTGFLENLLGFLGNMFKFYIGYKVLDWISKPENRQTVKNVINGVIEFGKFVVKWAKFGVTSTIDGLYDLFSDETNWWEKTLGFGKAIIGVGSILLGVRYLSNPLKIIKDIGTSIKLLIAFTKGKGALGMLGKIGLGAGALWLLSEGVMTNSVADGTNDSISEELTPEQKKIAEELRKQREKDGTQLPYPQRAGGGWISGPQSGYPVSLDGGKSTSFIGHGTEYVARKAGGGAFVIPYNTSATKRMPGLTDKRLGEAKKAGFKLPGFAAGGNLDKQIYLHWTAGGYNYKKNGPYHTIVQGDGSLHRGVKYPDQHPDGHTWRRNSGNYSISAASMYKYDWNNYSPKPKQIQSMAIDAARQAKEWGWKPSDVTIKRLMTHAEAASNKDGRKPTYNYGPVWWGGTGERSDFHKLKKSDPDGSGGDKFRQMIKKYMGMQNAPMLNESGPGAGGGDTAKGQISSAEYQLLQKLVLAEAGGEGHLGMALVARSVLNRAGLVQKGIVGPGIFMAKSGSINDIIFGSGPQYSPTKDGSLFAFRSPDAMEKAKKAIELARDPQKLRAALQADSLSSRISAEQINYLMAATGFRNYDAAFVDPSQQVNEVKYGNHTFNTASNKGLKTPESEITEAGHTGGGISSDTSSVPGAGNTSFSMDKPSVFGSLTGAASTRHKTSMGDLSQSGTGVTAGQRLDGSNVRGSGSASSQEMQRATQQRNDAKQRILQFAQEGVQAVVMQVTGNNAQASQAATSAMQVVQQMAQNQSQGAPIMSGTGSGIIKTTASVLNSFNNPLKGIFK